MSELPGKLSRAIQALQLKTELPPIETWNPECTGDSGILIDTQGSWFHEGSEISRAGLVRLFSTILRREKDDVYYLVTPGEKMTVEVQDAPFVAVDVEALANNHNGLVFTTNVGDQVTLSKKHPIQLLTDSHGQQEIPYITVRDGLKARIGRNLFYYLIDNFGVQQSVDGQLYLGIDSDNCFYPLGVLTED